ncbi:MAG: hypothetical protein AAFY36_00620 [Bacteroidota bacterium]
MRWNFYNFSINHIDHWDELILVSNTGGPLANLKMKDNWENGFLKLLEAGKKIDLFQLYEDPVYIEGDNKLEGRPVLMSEWLKNQSSDYGNSFRIYDYSQVNNSHKMALFLKYELHPNGEKNIKKPVFGIYFQSPRSRNRINPVWFSDYEGGINNNDRQNLEILQKYLAEIRNKKKES